MNRRSGPRPILSIAGLVALCALAGCASGHNLSLNSRVPRTAQPATSAPPDTRAVFAEALGPTSDVLVADGNVLLPGSFANPSTLPTQTQGSLGVAAGAPGPHLAVQVGLGGSTNLSTTAGLTNGAVGVALGTNANLALAAPTTALTAATTANVALAGPSGALAVGAGANVGLAAPAALAVSADASIVLGGAASQPTAAVSTSVAASIGTVGASVTTSAALTPSNPASPVAVASNLAVGPVAVSVAAAPSLAPTAGSSAPTANLTVAVASPTGSSTQPVLGASLVGTSAQLTANPQALAAAIPGSVKLTDLVAGVASTLRLGGR